MSGPPGSAAIEKLFQDYFKSKGEPYDPSEFDGRSDYGPFIVSCIRPISSSRSLNKEMSIGSWFTQWWPVHRC